MLGWKVGNVSITSVVESETTAIGGAMFPEITPGDLAAIEWLAPNFVDESGLMKFAIQAFLVEAGGRRILVDTCVGNDKDRPFPEWDHMSGPFLEDLARAGAERESVDVVMCTHLHMDHVGWNTMLVDGNWVPTFPNARYLFARSEWEHWKEESEKFGSLISDSLQPIVDAGLVELVETDHTISDELQLEPTPGHTPGHVSLHIRSAGEEAVITGDMFHHPCQIARPQWAVSVDFSQEQSTATRHDFLARYAGAPVLIIGSHFVAPTAGRIVRDGDSCRLKS